VRRQRNNLFSGPAGGELKFTARPGEHQEPEAGAAAQ
jgi:hypothetical protein